MSLKVKFVGAVGTVTGSCSLLHYGLTDSYYLVDCGLYQGFPGDTERNRRKFCFDPARLSAVFLTHAHIDHCGLLPRLVAEGFKGKVICTRVTARFTMIALMDSARRGDQPYTLDDVRKLEAMFQCPDDADDFRFGYYYPIEQDFLISFIRTAHIVGSVAIEFRVNVSTTDRLTIVFSGDVGPCSDGATHGGLQKQRQYPNPEAKYLVCESTYGGKTRKPEVGTFEGRTQALARVLERAFARGSEPVIVIPSFSLQRAQDLVVDLAYALQHLLPAWDPSLTPCIVVDSGMAKEHSRVMCRELQRVDARRKRPFLNTDSPLFAGMDAGGINAALTSWLDVSPGGAVQESGGRKWGLIYGEFGGNNLPPGPRIVIASSGNCLGGPVIEHLANQATNPQATLVFSGYLPPSSPGYALKSLAVATTAQEREVVKFKLGDREFKGTDVTAAIEDLSAFCSGHADEAGLVDFVLRRDTNRPSPALSVFLNHGDRRARTSLKERLEQTAQDTSGGWRQLEAVYLPEAKDGWFDLVGGQWEPPDDSVGDFRERLELLEQKMEELMANQERILRLLA